MNLEMPAEQLSKLISGYARAAIESRQVAKRLKDFLPLRFSEIRVAKFGTKSSGEIERQTLIDPTYMKRIDELVDMNARAREARIQYETHNMLFEARRSLRLLPNSRQVRYDHRP